MSAIKPAMKTTACQNYSSKTGRDVDIAEPSSPRVALCAAGEIWGGVEHFICILARELKRRGVYLIVILFNDGLLAEKLREDGISVKVVRSTFRYDPSAIIKMGRLLKTHCVDIVHVHGYKASILGGIAATLLGLGAIKTEHGALEPCHGVGRLKMRFNLFLDKYISRHMLGGIVFVSSDIYNASNGHSSVKQYVVHNGIDVIVPNTGEPFALEAGFFNIGIVGRVSAIKGHAYLLKAMSYLRLNNFRLYVFGSGPLEQECKDYCAVNGLQNVRFMGFKENMRGYMRNLDLLVMPSLHEGLPYTLLEAMCLKVPVVASDVGGIKEVISNGYDGILVPPMDAVALARAIRDLHLEPEYRRFLVRNAYKKVCSHFSASTMGDNYLNIYRQILSES